MGADNFTIGSNYWHRYNNVYFVQSTMTQIRTN